MQVVCIYKSLAENYGRGRISSMIFNPQLRTPPLGNTRPGPLADTRERRGLRVTRELSAAVTSMSSHMGEYGPVQVQAIDGQVYEVEGKASVGSDSLRSFWTLQFLPESKVNISVPLCYFEVTSVLTAQPKIKLDGVDADYIDPTKNILVIPRTISRIYLRCTVDDTSVDGLDTQAVDIVALDGSAVSQLVNSPTIRYIPLIDVDYDALKQSRPFQSGGLRTTRFGDRRRIDNMFWYPT